MKIEELTLYTSQLKAQEDFYSEVLGLQIVHSSNDGITFIVGNTLLTFLERNHTNPYHFAINIPAHQIQEALVWLKQRVTIQCDNTKEIVDFPAWNAQSIYFYDADKNILEFIGRRDLAITIPTPFSGESLFEISEIGIATAHFEEKYTTLLTELKLEKFGGGKEVFAAFGSDNGLFILIDKTRKTWFPTNDKAYAADFRVKINVKGSKSLVHYKNEILSVQKNLE